MAQGVKITGRGTPVFGEKYDEQFKIIDVDYGAPIPYQRYRITASDGQSWEGMTNAKGETMRVHTRTASELTLEMLEEEEDPSQE